VELYTKRRLEWATHFLGEGSWVICPSTCRKPCLSKD
jgi:hypothetical protein